MSEDPKMTAAEDARLGRFVADFKAAKSPEDLRAALDWLSAGDAVELIDRALKR